MARDGGVTFARPGSRPRSTTVDKVRQAHDDGVTSPNPITREAAEPSLARGTTTAMGAPNVVRGGSHSGNGPAHALAEDGPLGILSSDCVPSALLMAAFRVVEVSAFGGLPATTRARGVARGTTGGVARGTTGGLTRVEAA